LISLLKHDKKLKKLVENDKPKDCELLYIENWTQKYLKENFNVDVSEAELEEPKKIIEDIYRKHKEPEKYYSILIMDGDNMGKMLVGDEMKPVRDYLHPEVLKYLPPEAKEKVEKTKRLITPATHSAISRALAYFSIRKVPEIVENENHRGELIYAGGDDVLALLPIDSVLRCAYEIQKTFRKDWDGWELLPAKTMSAGILIVHYKHPLYDALDKARSLENKAKDFGRDAVAIGYLARSGSYNEVVFNWSIVPKLDKFIKLIKNSEKDEKPSLSKRIIYHVVQEIDTLPNNEKALKEFLKFEFSRHYKGNEKIEDLADKIIELAKNVRVTITDADFKDLGLNLKRSKRARVNLKVNKLIRREDLTVGRLYDELKEILEINCCDLYENLYGLILKKQIKGLFILLKILVDCDADLGGECNEDNN
jgi:CRISPR-associated protein Cmr2